MCVIVYKPKGVRMPSSNIIRACARANRDGFGFCTPNKFVWQLMAACARAIATLSRKVTFSLLTMAF